MTINEAIEDYKRIADAYERVGNSKDAEETAQIAEWLRRARGAEDAAQWFTSRIWELKAKNKRLQDENARLRSCLSDDAENKQLRSNVERYRNRMHELGIEVM